MNVAARKSGVAMALCGFTLMLNTSALATQTGNAPAQQSAPAEKSFKIAGTAVNAITGAPLAQARISLADTRNRRRMIAMVTSENGHFEFSRLPAGKYSLEGAKRGFISAAYEQHEQFSTAIVTGPEFATDKLMLRLTPMALISGHVTDESGDAVRDAQVSLFLEDHRGGMTRIARARSSPGDDRGYYEFSSLRPGSYFVSVDAKPWYAVHPMKTADNGENSPPRVSPGLDVTYPTTYNGGATEAEDATPIAVKGGDKLQIDMRLNPIPALRLIIRVPVEQPGEPDRFSRPILEKHTFDSEEFVGTNIVIEAPGVFEITGVPQGRYTVRFRDPKSGQLAESTDVEVTRDGQELTGSQGEALGSLKLTLKMPDEEPMPKLYSVGLQNSHLKIVGFRQGDATGQVTFENLAPGKYTILLNVQGKPYAVVRTSLPAGVSVGHGVNIALGTALELTAWLAAGVVRIEGSVQKQGKPVAGMMVALVPNDPEAHVDYFRRDQSDFDGTFLLQGVFPGTYTIVAVEDAWGSDWLQPGALARYVQHGQNVNVGELLRGTVHLPEAVEVQPR